MEGDNRRPDRSNSRDSRASRSHSRDRYRSSRRSRSSSRRRRDSRSPSYGRGRSRSNRYLPLCGVYGSSYDRSHGYHSRRDRSRSGSYDRRSYHSDRRDYPSSSFLFLVYPLGGYDAYSSSHYGSRSYRDASSFFLVGSHRRPDTRRYNSAYSGGSGYRGANDGAFAGEHLKDIQWDNLTLTKFEKNFYHVASRSVC